MRLEPWKMMQRLFLLGFCWWLAMGQAHAGQEQLIDTAEDLKKSSLVALVEVTEVQKVEVPAMLGDLKNPTVVYVATARVIQTIKTDHFPTPEKRTICIVGSTKPRSTAVWRPIEKGRYLAFLKSEQGHYSYSFNLSFQKIGNDELVRWCKYENISTAKHNAPPGVSKIKLKEAVAKLTALVPRKYRDN